MKPGFCYWGLIVFSLPMVVNIFYVLFPPVGEATSDKKLPRWLEIIEQVTRILYLLLLTLVVSDKPVDFASAWLWVGVVFLVLYHIVWARYFIGGRNVELLCKPFLFVPMPLALFPVAYYLCCALWLGNWYAFAAMCVCGAAHITVSFKSFR